jgi:hypothetical protein
LSALAVFTVGSSLLVHTVIQPTVANSRTYRPFMERVRAHVGNAPLFFYQAFDNGALYYANRRIPYYESAPPGVDPPYFVLMRHERWEEIVADDGSSLPLVDVSEGTGPKGRHRLALVLVRTAASLPADDEPGAIDDNDTEETAEDDTL